MPVPDSDLNARARIRNAAFLVIAELGVARTTIRGIAARAGVSPALVLHHYGSKQGVVDAVSAWVVRHLRTVTSDVRTSASAVDAHRDRQLRFERAVSETPRLGDYVRRMLLDGSREGVEWFTQAVESSAAALAERERAGMARPSKDLRTEAAMLLLLGFAPVLLQPLLEHALGVDFGTAAARRRWRDAESELLTSPLYAPAPSAPRQEALGRRPRPLKAERAPADD
jgi:AcrR family transcriptional regulator